MRAYTADQWILFFFMYCLCGWIWESCYVSIRQRQWVNRGFLHGPILPLYGSGAIIILLSTIRVQSEVPLVFLLGMVAATILEYATGAAMEGLFKVRYWDYSHQKFNHNGYICLSSSIAWGFFSLLLVGVIHPPISQLLLRIPGFVTVPLALALTVWFAVDAVQSVRAAMDLRRMLEKLTEENEDLRRLARRVEIISAFAEDDLQRFRDRTQVERILLQERLGAELRERGEARSARKLRREERLAKTLQSHVGAKLKALENIASVLEACRDKLDERFAGEALAEKRAELDEALAKLHSRQTLVGTRTAKGYRQALRILRGNPSAKVKQRYAEALESLRHLM